MCCIFSPCIHALSVASVLFSVFCTKLTYLASACLLYSCITPACISLATMIKSKSCTQLNCGYMKMCSSPLAKSPATMQSRLASACPMSAKKIKIICKLTLPSGLTTCTRTILCMLHGHDLCQWFMS